MMIKAHILSKERITTTMQRPDCRIAMIKNYRKCVGFGVGVGVSFGVGFGFAVGVGVGVCFGFGVSFGVGGSRHS